MKNSKQSNVNEIHKSPPPLKKRWREFNYYYFGFFFVILALFHIYHVILIEPGQVFSHFFYFIVAIAQCFIEAIALMMLATFMQRFSHRFISIGFIVLTFLLFVAHLIDFPLVRIMDISIWYGLSFITQESPRNFLEILYASNISIQTWILVAIFTAVLVVCGMLFFIMTAKLADKNPLPYSLAAVARTLCCTLAFLFAWDLGLARFTLSHAQDEYHQALPWKMTFFDFPIKTLPIAFAKEGEIDEKNALSQLETLPASLKVKPNIFVFIAESLRDDFITPQIAPHLHQFKHDYIDFDSAFANANATQLSWFSIFQARFPFYWEKMRPDAWKSGSLPLNVLNKMGYKIRVYSASRLHYYQMDEMIFGEKCYLADSFHYFPHGGETVAYESDKNVFAKMLEDVKANPDQGGEVYIVFLDSTHFEYSWPEAETYFKPIVKDVNYFQAAFSKMDLEGLKNRYRNAIHHLDKLFGSFQTELRTQGKWDDAVVVFAADHGEEFFERGHLYHASNLNTAQTAIPLYYKFGLQGRENAANRERMSCHIDIFPSILHYIFGENVLKECFDGESIFNKEKWPFTVSARYNASRGPCEFSIQSRQHKLIARFSNENEIFKSDQLCIKATRDLCDDPISFDQEALHHEFDQALDRIFSK